MSMHEEKKLKDTPHGSRKSYVIGFALSILLTLAAYFPVVMHQQSQHYLFSHELLIYLVSFLAVLQLIVQLVFFLHLFEKENREWNVIFFVSTLSIVLIVVVGSIWIMNHLNYNMSPMKMDQYIIQDEGIHQ